MLCCISVVKLGRVQDCAVFAELYRKLQGQVGAGMTVLVNGMASNTLCHLFPVGQIQIQIQIQIQQFAD